jgi:hypothetical protein
VHGGEEALVKLYLAGSGFCGHFSAFMDRIVSSVVKWRRRHAAADVVRTGEIEKALNSTLRSCWRPSNSIKRVCKPDGAL